MTWSVPGRAGGREGGGRKELEEEETEGGGSSYCLAAEAVRIAWIGLESSGGSYVGACRLVGLIGLTVFVVLMVFSVLMFVFAPSGMYKGSRPRWRQVMLSPSHE